MRREMSEARNEIFKVHIRETMITDFRKLEIWKRSRTLVKKTYLTLEEFPNSEKFDLTSQLKRSAIIVPSNIAEGCGRRTNKDLSRFLDIAVGSLCEVETQIYLANDLEFISNQQMDEILNETIQIRKMIVGF
jgi:four helix bundle protein